MGYDFCLPSYQDFDTIIVIEHPLSWFVVSQLITCYLV